MVKDTQLIRRQKPMNYLSVFDHLVELTLKGLMLFTMISTPSILP